MKKFILILIIFFLSSSVAAADIDTDMKRFFSDIVIKIENINTIKGEKNKKEAIKKTASSIMDLKWMGNFILGKAKKSLEKGDVDKFIDLYSDFTIKNYFKILLLINKDNYKITSIDSQRENVYMVNVIIRYNDIDTKDSFRVIKKGDKYFITDVITEGISFISVQRSDVNSRIDNVGFEKFINEIKNTLDK